jgi:hypothetical protein
VIALIAVTAGVVHLACWGVSARWLFARWRPSRVPLCTKQTHLHPPANGRKWRDGHHVSCYHRVKPDLTTGQMDSDAEASFGALISGFFWPFILAAMLISRGAPELEEEKKARLAALDRKIEEAQAELDAGRN